MTRDQLRIAEKVIKSRYRALRNGVSYAQDARDESLRPLPIAPEKFGGYGCQYSSPVEWLNKGNGISPRFRKWYITYFKGLPALLTARRRMETRQQAEEDACSKVETEHRDKLDRLVETENNERADEAQTIQAIRRQACHKLTIAEDEHVVSLHMNGDGVMRDFVTSLPTAKDIAGELVAAGFKLTSEIVEGRLLGNEWNQPQP